MAAPPAAHDPLDDWDEPPRLYFSTMEVLHLLASVVVLTLAFSLILSRSGEATFGPLIPNTDALLRALPYAAITVVPAFILHELAHKIVAQRRDMFAEFRANFFGLIGGLILTELSGLLFAIPGAVVIYGAADKRDAGVISIVGPGVNLVIGYGALVAHVLFLNQRIGHAIVANAGMGDVFQLMALMNAILAAFNMLPVPPLDGSKVWKWSKLGFAGAWALVISLFMFVLL